ncbi:hypothetical protein M758_4G118200 [Ceratodon purpureus]|nr:hypothetical protein M758_4G118200 [Ceratodon purpureus]
MFTVMSGKGKSVLWCRDPIRALLANAFHVQIVLPSPLANFEVILQSTGKNQASISMQTRFAFLPDRKEPGKHSKLINIAVIGELETIVYDSCWPCTRVTVQSSKSGLRNRQKIHKFRMQGHHLLGMIYGATQLNRSLVQRRNLCRYLRFTTSRL